MDKGKIRLATILATVGTGSFMAILYLVLVMQVTDYSEQNNRKKGSLR